MKYTMINEYLLLLSDTMTIDTMIVLVIDMIIQLSIQYLLNIQYTCIVYYYYIIIVILMSI